MPTQSIAFDRAASFYDETRGFPPGVEQEAVALVVRLAGLNAAARLLEIGVGTGRIAVPLAAHAGSVTGLDLSLPMLRRLYEKRRGKRIWVAQADATRLPLPSGAFDAAVAVHVFHLIPNWPDALRELARVLKPGGLFIHCATRREDGQVFGALDAALDAVISRERRARPGLPGDRAPSLLPDEGWELLAASGYPFVEYYSAQGFLDHFARRTSTDTWRLSDDEIARGVAALRAAMAEHYPEPERLMAVPSVFSVWVGRWPQR